MPPVTQRLPDLLGGVSQRPPHLRKENELEESLNAYHSAARGFGKRPNTRHVARLSPSPSTFAAAAVRALDYGATERFFAAILNGDLKVWDEAGVEQAVSFPHGTGYLALTAGDSIRSVTVDTRTFIANREVTAQRDATRKAPWQTPQALLYVAQADYSTTYQVTVDGTTVLYETEPGADPSSRRQIATDFIARQLRDRLVDTFTGFSFDIFGSMLRVQRTDATDFSISTKDGLADNGLLAIKGLVQRSADLPLRCLDKFVLEVVGDPEREGDNYWVQFDADGSDDFRGVWRECARPGEAIALDAATLPHVLVYSDELTPELAHSGLPGLPVVAAGEPSVDHIYPWDEAALTWFPVHLEDHLDAAHATLTDANGGPAKVKVMYRVDTTQLLPTDSVVLKIGHNTTPGDTTYIEDKLLVFPAGLYLDYAPVEVDISANLLAGCQIKVWIEYQSGGTPDKKAKILLLGLSNRVDLTGFVLSVYSAKEVTWPETRVYPKNATWTIYVDTTPVSYSPTADSTGKQIAQALVPLVDALAGYTATFVTNAKGSAVHITKDAGGLPDVSVVVVFSEATNLWCPDTDLGSTPDTLVGKTLKNLSDGSTGTVTANYAHGVTVGAMTGGVENHFRAGDKCIVVDSVKSFTFRRVSWKERAAGSALTNPWPSFAGTTVRDVFFHRGRLGILAGANVVFSESGVAENFFRTATTDLIDSDPIDVAWAGGSTARFHAAVPWNGDLVLFGDRVQVVPRGEPVLSAKTIRLEQLCAYPCDPSAVPTAAGRWVFFGRPFSGQTHVSVLGVSPRTRVAEAKMITDGLPSYIVGAPQHFAVDPTLGQLLLTTDADPSTLYQLRYHLTDDEEFVPSWGKWTFTGDVLGMDIGDGIVSFIIKYPDGVFLETLDLSETY